VHHLDQADLGGGVALGAVRPVAPARAGTFKIPPLRQVARTGPYFHDGSVPTLDEAVVAMASHELGVELTPRDTQVIVAFLGALTGSLAP
jgi:cytochrome c peroxidase